MEKILNILCNGISVNIKTPTEKPHYTVIVEEEMLKEIDDFRFENRYPSRLAATSELIRLGMEQIEKEQEEAIKAQKNKPSQTKPRKRASIS